MYFLFNTSQIRTPFASLVAKKLFIEGDEIENETLDNEGLYEWLGLILGIALGLLGLLYLDHLSSENFVCCILCLVPFTTLLLILIFSDFKGDEAKENRVVLSTAKCRSCDVSIGRNKQYCQSCRQTNSQNSTSKFEFDETTKLQSNNKTKTGLTYRCRSCDVKIGMYKLYCKSCKREQELETNRSFSRYSTNPQSDYIPRTQPINNTQTKPINNLQTKPITSTPKKRGKWVDTKCTKCGKLKPMRKTGIITRLIGTTVATTFAGPLGLMMLADWDTYDFKCAECEKKFPTGPLY